MSIVIAKAKQCVSFFLLAILALPLLTAADDLQKSQKKELEAAAKALNEEGKSLEKSGKLVEARLKYAESLGYIELNDASQAVSRLDDTLKTSARAAVAAAQKLYEAGKYKEAAQALEEALNLQAFRPVLAYNLALSYNQLGERQKAVDYLDQAIAGTGAPKLRARLSQTRTPSSPRKQSRSLASPQRNRSSCLTTLPRLLETVLPPKMNWEMRRS